MNTAHVLLFHCHPDELGWEAELVDSEEYRGHIEELMKATLFDIAEECAAISGTRVLLHTIPSYTFPDDEVRLLPVEHRVQPEGVIASRVVEAVASLYREDAGVIVIVILANNPLFLGTRIERARHLLEMEEETIVVGEGLVGESNRLVFVATRGFHPMVYESVQAISQAGALMVPLASVRCVTSIDDMVYLLHEVERAQLLGRSFPKRTYTKLNWMRKRQFIPEFD